ncbi:MAG: OprD family outer membrane porin [Bacteroidia bacterium]
MKLAFLTFFVFLFGYSFAQIFPYQHHTERERDKSDTTTLQHFFRNGEFYGHARYYFMATDNDEDLTDYFSNAFGMGIGYETGKFKGFQIGLSGFFIYNLWSSDLTKPDPKTGTFSRYESGQFDLFNLGNKHDMDRLEDLYLKYSTKKFSIKFGKQHIRSPFINPQDGRMRPTLVEGALFELKPLEKTKLEGGWIFAVSPRGTVSYFSTANSIGIFPSGVNPDGTKSNYTNNLTSKGVFYLGLNQTINQYLKIQAWNQTIENIQNSSMLQLNTQFKLNNHNNFVFASQYIHQFAINDGGNLDQSKTYVLRGNKANTFGFRLGFLNEEKNWQVLLNYNRITKHGRYLMPREWGRDPFFTFMPRERNEGNADVHAFTTTGIKSFGKSGWKSEVTYGRFFMPDVTNTAFNKYGMPSYWQLNADIRHHFKHFLKGLEMQLLYVYKGNMANTYDNPRFVINKVNMSLYNIVFNYHF